ncbi:hypothetical protein SCHPADRAFT_926797 [Schizopora paradoxa]|uniref:Uncharacterized protein n=1 Tax=Schizopora paradoxa TaxID=27342 RepID=A0A0H2RWP0_9AGAM|nr:hypothetical protein SCHPADRAFT_926797 [Schizopora paradoxa]
MSKRPIPPPGYTVRGRKVAREEFRHQVLGYPMTVEWLLKRSKELFGREDIFAAAWQLKLDSGHHRTLHAVYDEKKDEYMLVLSMGENVSMATLRRPPEEECEWFKKYLGLVDPYFLNPHLTQLCSEVLFSGKPPRPPRIVHDESLLKASSKRKHIVMATTPRPLPVYIAAGRRNRGFRYQVLGCPMTQEWLTKRSLEVFGRDDFFAEAMKTFAEFKRDEIVHAIYDRKNKKYALAVSMGENVTVETLRDPPEEECEWFRQYLGVERRPLCTLVSFTDHEKDPYIN